MPWKFLYTDPESGLYQYQNTDTGELRWAGQDGTYRNANGETAGNLFTDVALNTPTPAGWTYAPAYDNGEGGSSGARWSYDAGNGVRFGLDFNPAVGPSSREQAIEAMYFPNAYGRPDLGQQIYNLNPGAWSQYGDANSLYNESGRLNYNRLNNIDNDPIAKIMNPLIQGGVMAGLGAGAMNLAGLTSFGDGSWLNDWFGGPSTTVTQGASPTQVGGWNWSEPTFSGTFDPTLPGTPPMPAPGMPPAIPETTQQLTEWGLKEVSPGVWSQPAMPDISMSAGDWLKYGGSLLGNSLGGNVLNGITSPNSGGLFSSLFGNGFGGLVDKGIASAPVLAAINYARNQDPFDTSRLTSLYDQYDPSKLAYEYDLNTGRGRDQLTSSLQNRGVMGSSFGNMDITNFNTTRELGRQSLINQGIGQRGQIASNILDAEVKGRQLKNQLYGSSLLALGNVFGGRSSPTINFGGV